MDQSMKRGRLFVLISFCWWFASADPMQAVEQGVPLDIRWMGTDLVDEFVHDMELNPPFSLQTLVALTEISAPVGLDSRFETLAENHLYDLLKAHSQTNIQLGFCSACRKFVVKSTRSGTFLSRGSDQPELLRSLSAAEGAKYGLSLHYEAENDTLTLRAQIYQLTEPGQPIIWARVYNIQTSARLALQSDKNLMTLKEAQKTQEDIIRGREPLEWVSRVTATIYTAKGAEAIGAPLLFAEQSVEGVLLPRRNRRMALTVGATSIEKSITGYKVGGHFAQLLFRSEPSLVSPDLYGFFGFHFVRLRGPGALPFSEGQIDALRALKISTEPKASFVSYRIGLEVHAKHRFGAVLFLENSPTLNKNEFFVTETFLGIPYHAYGMGMVVKW